MNDVTFLDEFAYQREETKQQAIRSFFLRLLYDLNTG